MPAFRSIKQFCIINYVPKPSSAQSTAEPKFWYNQSKGVHLLKNIQAKLKPIRVQAVQFFIFPPRKKPSYVSIMSGSSPLAPNTPSTPVSSTTITTGISFKRQFRPYFTKRQLASLSSLKKSGPLTVKENNARYTYCKFMQEVGKKLGL